MRFLSRLPLVLCAAAILWAGSWASASVEPVNLTIDPSSSANVQVDVSYKLLFVWLDSSANQNVSVSGYMPANLTMDFDPTSYEATLSGIEFTGGPFTFSPIDMSFYGGSVHATGSNIGGDFDTPAPPGSVTATSPSVYTFDLGEHQAILNQGQFDVTSTIPAVPAMTVDLSTDNMEATLSGTGEISIGTPSIVTNGSTTTCTYNVALEMPLNYDQSVDTGDENLKLDIAATGTYYATGQIEKTFYTSPEVTLGLVDNGSPASGLRSYTLTATGPGITSLAEFTIDGEVHQVFAEYDPPGPDPVEIVQTEWLGDAASETEETDSYVIFGDLRLPDLGGETWPGPGEQPDKITEETIDDGGTLSGMGTLNNFDDSVIAIHDCYMRTGTPGGEETVELMQLVVENGKGLDIDLTLFTSTEHDPVTGESIVDEHHLSYAFSSSGPGDANGDGYVDSNDVAILSAHWLQAGNWADGDFSGDGVVNDKDATMLASNWNPPSASVPEPGTLVLLAGMLLLAGFSRRK